MKQIDIIKTYAQKRCLVVDDAPPARASLTRLLTDFGSENVDTAGNAEEAIDMCERNQYDIVISDYTLGSGKNGQQLLEELRYHHLLRHTALFVMITAESASHFVLHALEYEPDDFLQKPVHKQSLRPRLDAALLKAEYLFDIKAELDNDRIDAAIHIAENRAAEPGRFQNDVKKVLAELYIKCNNTEKAETIYEHVCNHSDRAPLWARLGKARVSQLQKRYEEAEEALLEIISENSRCIEAMDLLAHTYRETNRLDQAQHALLSAVQASPRAPQRQRELAQVSDDLEDENTAVVALRSAIRHAKNSCHEAPDDHVKLADSLIRLSKKEVGDRQKELAREARDNLEVSNKRFEKQPIVRMRSHLIEAEMQSMLGKHERAAHEIDAAIAIHESLRYGVIENSATQLCIDCAKAFIAQGCSDEGEAILQELASLHGCDSRYSLAIDKLLREPKTKEGIRHAATQNREGISYYNENRLNDALVAFKAVLKELPNHIGLNLNLIQVLVSRHKLNALAEAEIDLLASCFRRIGHIDTDSNYHKRYAYLKKRYDAIQSSLRTAERS